MQLNSNRQKTVWLVRGIHNSWDQALALLVQPKRFLAIYLCQPVPGIATRSRNYSCDRFHTQAAFVSERVWNEQLISFLVVL